MKEITLLANAKLNLYLDITGRRADGYHLLETVMQSVDLCDVVSVRLCGEGITVSCSDPRIPGGEANICYKAARAFFGTAGISAGAEIYIEKRIPSGAGMGGGSADAAAVLRGLNTLYGAALSDEELSRAALSVGADVPFCLFGGTKLCRGIGELMEDIPPVRDVCFLVIMPQFTCPTGEAYRRWDSAPLSPRGLLAAFLEGGAYSPEKMYNVFETLYDDARIENIRQRLLIEGGAKGAMMTGSGAAVFGIFEGEDAASKAAALFPQCFSAVCRPSGQSVKAL